MKFFHRNPPAAVALPELDAALRSLSAVEPPAGLAERLTLAVERAACALPAKSPERLGRFGLLSFAGRLPMRLAASLAVGIAMIGGLAAYEWQGQHHSSPMIVPARTGGGFGAAGAAHTPTLATPIQTIAPPASTTHKSAPATAPALADHASVPPHHTVSSRAHLPQHPILIHPAPQP